MEVTEQIQVQQSPLAQWHVTHGAKMTIVNGSSVPAHYGEWLIEYTTVRDGKAGLFDLSSRGRIRVTGSEAILFLNGLITNDMKTLGERSWMSAVFPNVQGRILAAVRVARVSDEHREKGAVPVFLLETEHATHERVFKAIERFTFAGDFQVADLSSTTGEISVQGAASADMLASVFGEAWNGPEAGGLTVLRWKDSEVIVLRASHTGEDGFDLIVSNAEMDSLATAILNVGATPVGYKALEVLRIEAGISQYGPDYDESMVVSEANLDDAVSFTKGCYIGQEIIARIKYRGHVAKKITGVSFDETVNVEGGATLFSDDDKEIGRITSVAHSPQLKRTIALALIKYQYLSAGTKVKAKSGDEEVQGTVTELPFVKPAEDVGFGS